ncbi:MULTISPECIES: phage tail sheath C-terminal domain-containing protein [unclassified Nodularia (in: cyanobacteria)]|uniref:phage tail sheath family protein n=1 Tax=unclassified Nodularia (in: cyanobacteria) TaxID=2656917 RepID=UPI0018823001|nr:MULTISPECIES: phage tail sheath C-terminal domain-containing protein [unclassified Nodularia (in: cyanobacteria)]MBE9199618.1 phage tail sheath family protein [Nodularia sp. LEGE 06071]MCC2694947.1 phage tail sheath family protein [Nodularia sp. LEGE 04288]
MPVNPTYPGVYIEEISSGVRTITGVSTSITAFVGYTPRGTLNKAVRIFNFGDFERAFGGLHPDSEISYSIQQFFLNGGSDAYVVRVAQGASQASQILKYGTGEDDNALTVKAANGGKWGEDLFVKVEHVPDSPTTFNLTVTRQVQQGNSADRVPVEIEKFLNLSMDSKSAKYAPDVVNSDSQLIRLEIPIESSDNEIRPLETSTQLTNGADGTKPSANDILGESDAKTGIYALRDVDLFNLLVIPETTTLSETAGKDVIQKAVQFCAEQRAFYIIDPPPSKGFTEIGDWAVGASKDKNAAIFFPRILAADPKKDFRLRDFPASGAIAGIFSRTDSERGVWKAPAGIEAVIRGAQGLSYTLTDPENGVLNPLGINCLRTFPTYGTIVWGARTRQGADQDASEWKYIPVRRLALFLEESLYRGTQWVVFEPNDEPLWAQIRLNLGAFMNNLFRQGAFQGKSPKEAYFVKCDSETTTQNDINLGIVNIVVGYAPLKPAEFVILKFQQMAGQIAV